MKFEDYMLADAQLNGPFELPASFFDAEGELQLEKGMEDLIAKGLIYNDSVEKPEYGDELKEMHPGAHRFLECYYDSQRRAVSDKLVEDRFADYYIEDGREVFRWTKKGIEYLAAQKLKLEEDSE